MIPMDTVPEREVEYGAPEWVDLSHHTSAHQSGPRIFHDVNAKQTYMVFPRPLIEHTRIREHWVQRNYNTMVKVRSFED